jgi:choline-sulfatase
VSETRLGGGGKLTNITGRMLRIGRYKYIIYSEGRNREQLFDLTKDPGEMTNLAVDPDHADGLRDCRGKLMQWCRDTEDPFAAVAAGA